MTTPTADPGPARASHDRSGETASAMRVTVAICTRNRAVDLTRALSSCERHRDEIEQVLVSDDSTHDATRQLVASRFPWVEYVEGPRRGLCANRNNAAGRARGSHVLFLDDDASLGTEFLRRTRAYVEAFDAEQAARTIVTGSVDEYGALLPPAEQSFLGHQKRIASADALVNVAMPAALFPRECLRLGFDERLVYGYDEIDFVVRAVKAGYTVHHCADAVNQHWRTPAGRDYYRGHQEAARLYVTFKRYALVERRLLRAAAFAALAPLHTFASAVRRGGPAGALAAARATATAARHVTEFYRSGA